MVGPRKIFKFADAAQQTVGGFLLAGPFVVTEEVWVLARQMTLLHSLVTVGIVFGIGYGTLYKADHDRDPEREPEVGGVPLRFISLMIVSYSSVTILAFTLAAPTTFEAGMETTLKAISVGAIFSVIGAATADSLF